MVRSGKNLGQGFANLCFVIDDEYLARVRARLGGGSRIDTARVPGNHGQRDGEYGSPHFGTIESKRAAVGFDDAVAHGQPHPRALPRWFGGEVRLEDPRTKVLWNPGPLSATAMRITRVSGSYRLATRIRRGPGRSCSNCCALTIKVQQDLMKLVGVGEDRRNALSKVESHFDAARANGVYR